VFRQFASIKIKLGLRVRVVLIDRRWLLKHAPAPENG
jgi:hypothetical protein